MKKRKTKKKTKKKKTKNKIKKKQQEQKNDVALKLPSFTTQSTYTRRSRTAEFWKRKHQSNLNVTPAVMIRFPSEIFVRNLWCVCGEMRQIIVSVDNSIDVAMITSFSYTLSQTGVWAVAVYKIYSYTAVLAHKLKWFVQHTSWPKGLNGGNGSTYLTTANPGTVMEYTVTTCYVYS